MSGPSPKAQLAIAVCLLVGFSVVVALMLGYAETWEQRVYVFGAVQAIVFTAVGWVFGREVNRQSAETAKQDAAEAKQDAKVKGEEARELAVEAEKGRMLAAAVEAAGGEPAEGGGPRDVSAIPPAGTSSSLASLKALAQKMYE